MAQGRSNGAGHHPDEIVAMLDAVPDLSPALNAASDEELVEIFRAFDLTITYDKHATTTPRGNDHARASARP